MKEESDLYLSSLKGESVKIFIKNNKNPINLEGILLAERRNWILIKTEFKKHVLINKNWIVTIFKKNGN